MDPNFQQGLPSNTTHLPVLDPKIPTLATLTGLGRARLLHLGPEDATFEAFKIPDMKSLDENSRKNVGKKPAENFDGDFCENKQNSKRSGWVMSE